MTWSWRRWSIGVEVAKEVLKVKDGAGVESLPQSAREPEVLREEGGASLGGSVSGREAPAEAPETALPTKAPSPGDSADGIPVSGPEAPARAPALSPRSKGRFRLLVVVETVSNPGGVVSIGTSASEVSTEGSTGSEGAKDWTMSTSVGSSGPFGISTLEAVVPPGRTSVADASAGSKDDAGGEEDGVELTMPLGGAAVATVGALEDAGGVGEEVVTAAKGATTTAVPSVAWRDRVLTPVTIASKSRAKSSGVLFGGTT